MEVQETLILKGPNCWAAHDRLIVMKVALEYAESIKAAAGDYMDMVWRMLDGFFNDEQDRQGEVETMAQNSGLGRVGYAIALTACLLQRQAGAGCGYKACLGSDASGNIQIAFEYADDQIGLLAAAVSIEMLSAMLKGRVYDPTSFIGVIQDKWEGIRSHQLAMSIVDEAARRKIPCLKLNSRMLLQLGYGSSQRKVQRSITDGTASIGVKIAGNKELSRALLRDHGIPIPAGTVIAGLGNLDRAIEEVGYPVVLKPVGGNNGRGVSVNIGNYQDAAKAFQTALSIYGSGGVVVEKYVPGFDYRILVINYKFVAAARRMPASVTGDGVSTIGQLIHIVNLDPRRGMGHTKPLTIIQVDGATQNILSRHGFTLETVLPMGKRFELKSIANASAGGTAADVTEQVHPENIMLAERISKIVGLDICGLDIICPDIAVPLAGNGGAVIEVNSGPGFRVHMYPAEGQPRNVAGAVLDMLFPGADDWRIPIVAVFGSSSVLADRVADALAQYGLRVGCSTSAGIRIQRCRMTSGANSEYGRAEFVLRDPTVDIAVFQCSAGAICETGLAFTYCNIAIVMEIEDDNARRTDLASSAAAPASPAAASPAAVAPAAVAPAAVAPAAAVIPGIVLPSGYAILNADDPVVYAMGQDLSCKVAYVSLKPDNCHVSAHVAAGGCAAFIRHGEIELWDGCERQLAIPMQAGADDHDLRRQVALSLVNWINGLSGKE